MRGSETVWWALQAARAANLAEAGEAPPLAGHEGITRRALIGAFAAAGVAAGLPRPVEAKVGAPPVAIIGGGIAGLAALYHLTQAGVDAQLYEARARLGGRMYTARAPGQPAFEMGGQTVNSDHADMNALCKAFGIGLIDRKGGAHRTMIMADGKPVSDAALVQAMRGIAGQIDVDAVRLDRDYARVAAELDQLSFTGYLDKHADLIAQPWVRRLLEATARTEYGCEPSEASAIELVFNLPAIDGRRLDVLSRSDERYLIAGGSSALVAAMGKKLAPRIMLNRKLVRIDPAGAGVILSFADGTKRTASAAVITGPASITRQIQFGVPLPPLWKRFIAEVGLGKNAKVNAAMAARPWDAPIGRGGEIWLTDPKSGVASGWDGGVRPAPGPGGVWTWFLGGDQVTAADLGPPADQAKAFARLAEPGVKGMTAATTGVVRRSAWHTDPLSRGAYVNFRPGQLTRFGGLIWTETDGIASPPVSAAPIHFAGEHLSDAYPGYMNGGAQTGRLVAQAIIGARAPARRMG